MIEGQILEFKILNIYKKPSFTNRDTGEVTQEIDIIQVSQNVTLKNGETKNIYSDIKAPESAQAFRNSINKLEFLNVKTAHVNNNTYYTLLSNKPVSKDLAEMMKKELAQNQNQKTA